MQCVHSMHNKYVIMVITIINYNNNNLYHILLVTIIIVCISTINIRITFTPVKLHLIAWTLQMVYNCRFAFDLADSRLCQCNG